MINKLKNHTIISSTHKLDDPVLIRVAEWANRQGLLNRECTNFHFVNMCFKCDIEEDYEEMHD